MSDDAPPPLPTPAPPLLERLAAAVADTSAPLDAADRAAMAVLLPLIDEHVIERAGQDAEFDADRRLAVAVHALAFARRVRTGEQPAELGPELYAQVPPERLEEARRLVDAYAAPLGRPVPDAEVLLFALHFEVARHQVPAGPPGGGGGAG